MVFWYPRGYIYQPNSAIVVSVRQSSVGPLNYVDKIMKWKTWRWSANNEGCAAKNVNVFITYPIVFDSRWSLSSLPISPVQGNLYANEKIIKISTTGKTMALVKESVFRYSFFFVGFVNFHQRVRCKIAHRHHLWDPWDVLTTEIRWWSYLVASWYREKFYFLKQLSCRVRNFVDSKLFQYVTYRGEIGFSNPPQC